MSEREPGLDAWGFPDDDDGWMERLARVENEEPLGYVGPYALIEEIGRGGQGVVYRARRDGRLLAVKRLLQGSFASADSRVRFDREIEAVRALSHPGIVTVVDVVEEGGQRFLVLEWVRGLPVTRWAAGEGIRRSVKDIVSLMRDVCDALLHAHQRGVIHRDLKPSNILVDGDGQARILDFGLAKLEAAGFGPAVPSSVTVATPGAFMGTFAYAAPEQLAGDPSHADARSDLYSVGVLLHEMLTGETPYPLGASLASAVHSITLKPPTPPSTINPSVDRSLDAIVLRALAKSPDERYASIDAMRRDLDRFLVGEPVEAERASIRRALSRVVRRHPLAASFATGTLLLIVAFGITMTLLYRRAERNALRATRVESFMVGTLQPDVGASGSGDELERVSHRATEELGGEPEVERGIREWLAFRFAEARVWERACSESARALELRRRLSVPEDLRTGTLLQVHGFALVLTGERAGLEDLERARVVIDREAGSESVESAGLWGTLGSAYAHLAASGDSARADGAYQRALEIFAAAAPTPSLAMARTLLEYGGFVADRGSTERACDLMRRAKETYAALPEVHPERVLATQRYGELLASIGRHAEAETHLREAVELRSGWLDLRLPSGYANIANTYFFRDRFDEALRYYELAVVSRCDHLSQTHPEARASFQHVAFDVRDHGLTGRSVRAFREAAADVAPWVLPLISFTGGQIATIYEDRGDVARADGIRAALAEPLRAAD